MHVHRGFWSTGPHWPTGAGTPPCRKTSYHCHPCDETSAPALPSLDLGPVPWAYVPQTVVTFIHLLDVGYVSVLPHYELLDVFLSIHFNSHKYAFGLEIPRFLYMGCIFFLTSMFSCTTGDTGSTLREYCSRPTRSPSCFFPRVLCRPRSLAECSHQSRAAQWPLSSPRSLLTSHSQDL